MEKVCNDITVGQLTSLFKEGFYSIKYIDSDNGKSLEPFDFENVTNMLIVKGFKVYLDTEDNTITLLIGVDGKQYSSLKKDDEVGANISDKDWIENTKKWD